MSHRDRNAAAPTAPAGRGFYVGGGIALMVLHCTADDMLIALATVAAALLAVGSLSWPTQQFAAVMLGTVAVSVVTTIAVEYLGTVAWQSWAYTEAMPTLPWLGTGVSPVVRWVVLPPLALVWARRQSAP